MRKAIVLVLMLSVLAVAYVLGNKWSNEKKAHDLIVSEIQNSSRRFEFAIDRYVGKVDGVTYKEVIDSAADDVERDDEAALRIATIQTQNHELLKKNALAYVGAIQSANRAISSDARLSVEANVARSRFNEAGEVVDRLLDSDARFYKDETDPLLDAIDAAREEMNFATLRRDDQRKDLKSALLSVAAAKEELAKSVPLGVLLDSDRMTRALELVESQISLGWFPELPPGDGEQKLRERHAEQRAKAAAIRQ